MAKPLQTWRNKSIDLAAWPTNNGGVSFTIRKSYKPKDSNEYKETKTLFPQDLAILLDLIKQAQDWINKNFSEPVAYVDTRPAHPSVQKIVDGIARTFGGSQAIDDDIPF